MLNVETKLIIEIIKDKWSVWLLMLLNNYYITYISFSLKYIYLCFFDILRKCYTLKQNQIRNH